MTTYINNRFFIQQCYQIIEEKKKRKIIAYIVIHVALKIKFEKLQF